TDVTKLQEHCTAPELSCAPDDRFRRGNFFIRSSSQGSTAEPFPGGNGPVCWSPQSPEALHCESRGFPARQQVSESSTAAPTVISGCGSRLTGCLCAV